MFKDWFKKKPAKTSAAPRKGLVLEAGIPPEERVDALPLPEAQFLRHYHGFGELPDDAQLRSTLLQILRQPDFLADLPRGTLHKLLAPGGPLAGAAVDPDALLRFLGVMHGEITRQMYIDSARRRVGARGIRFHLPAGAAASPEEQAIVEADPHGLGPGGYPFGALPENPHPGRAAKYYVRVILDEQA